MWGSLYFAGLIPSYWENYIDFENNANREFAKKYGFDFYDIIPFTESNDKEIIKRLANSDKNCIPGIISQLKSILNTKTVHLIFNGKNSFYYFTYFLIENNFDENSFNTHKRKIKRAFDELKTSYGEIDNQFLLKNSINFNPNKKIYMLPNTSSRSLNGFDEFTWINTLKKIKQIEKI